jgi:hypothetical protein
VANPTSANYVFLPWARQGAASGIQTPDMSANQRGVVSVTVGLRVNDTAPVERQVRLYGPGDVTGIDPRQVVRTDPRHQATNFEPNYFPAIEFDRPDFPWLFTPAKADDAGKLRPWLCLVVVRKQEGVTLHADRNLLLPVLEIKPGLYEHELPDLSESWAWAHVQVAGSRKDAVALKQALADDPALTVSRLLCPRRLDPLTEYLACVVPTFELGRKAGLGLPVQPEDESELKPAWAAGSPEPVRLPIYFHWEFRTGTGGDFEALVELLEARDSREFPAQVGKRHMDISQPGFSVSPPLPSGTVLELEGALRRVDANTAEWPQETRAPFQAELKKILNLPWEAMQEAGKDSLLAPPIYGRWQAARHTVDAAPPPPAPTPWLDELNLDPRHRAIAALGSAVVQTQQEPLMASAWEQLGEIERINQMRRQAQLGRAVNAVYYARHFDKFSEETLLKVVSAAQSRVVVASTGGNNVTTRMLLSQSISQSAIPAKAVSAPLRRLTSPRGVISTRFRTDSALPIAIVSKLNTTTIVQLHKKEAGLVTINQVSDDPGGTVAGPLKQTVRFENAGNALDATPPLGDFKVVPEGAPKRTLSDFTPGLPADSADAQAFRNAAKQHQAYLQKAFMSQTTSPALVRMNLVNTKAQLLQSVNPAKTMNARLQASLMIAGGTQSHADPLEPILDAPDFPQPMYEAIRDLSQEFLFPGLEHVPTNTVTLLKTNPKFVESFLVGLNAEMGRELLWRNYPTDQRGTYFRQFWDTSAGNDQPDIETINKWGDRQLGQNAGAGEQLVLLIRGELLRRYPNSVIYAVAAVQGQDQLELSSDPAMESHPLFRGTLKPDVTFLGFALTKAEAIADPGWFFVIQEQPTEPRFGLDVANFKKPLPELTTWNELSWRHLVDTEEELKSLAHASTKTALPEIDNAKWGRSSAHQAYITLQRPVRIAIHAREMIKEGSM